MNPSYTRIALSAITVLVVASLSPAAAFAADDADPTSHMHPEGSHPDPLARDGHPEDEGEEAAGRGLGDPSRKNFDAYSAPADGQGLGDLREHTDTAHDPSHGGHEQ